MAVCNIDFDSVQYFIVGIYHNLFIPSVAHVLLDCFQFRTIKGSAG